MTVIVSIGGIINIIISTASVTINLLPIFYLLYLRCGATMLSHIGKLVEKFVL